MPMENPPDTLTISRTELAALLNLWNECNVTRPDGRIIKLSVEERWGEVVFVTTNLFVTTSTTAVAKAPEIVLRPEYWYPGHAGHGYAEQNG